MFLKRQGAFYLEIGPPWMPLGEAVDSHGQSYYLVGCYRISPTRFVSVPISPLAEDQAEAYDLAQHCRSCPKELECLLDPTQRPVLPGTSL